MSEKGEDPVHALVNERQEAHDTGHDGSVQSSELPSFAQLMDSVKGSMPEIKVSLQQKADTCRSGLQKSSTYLMDALKSTVTQSVVAGTS